MNSPKNGTVAPPPTSKSTPTIAFLNIKTSQKTNLTTNNYNNRKQNMIIFKYKCKKTKRN